MHSHMFEEGFASGVRPPQEGEIVCPDEGNNPDPSSLASRTANTAANKHNAAWTITMSQCTHYGEDNACAEKRHNMRIACSLSSFRVAICLFLHTVCALLMSVFLIC